MDLVYVVKPGDDNPELRYSLRSVEQNLAHDRVWIVGYKPSWVRGVEYLPVNQYRSKWENSTANVMTACLTDAVSESFVLMNDDFYVVERVDEVEPLNRGRVRDVIADYRRRRRNGSYTEGMAQTSLLLGELGFDDPLSYELHVPMVVNRAAMVEALRIGIAGMERFPMQALHKRTLYGNLHDVGGRTIDDVKVTSWNLHRPLGPYVSSFRTSWSGVLGKEIRRLFRTPSRYERS